MTRPDPDPARHPDPHGRGESHAARRPGGRVLGEVHAPGSAAGPPAREEMASVWPELLFREVLVALLFVVVLAVISLLVNAPLEDPADPTRTPNPAKAPWYFVGLQELLAYFDPWIAGVMIPLVIVFGLCAIPYVDPTRTAQGIYSVRERPLASLIFIAGVVGWFVLIAIGLWFRGAGWAWTWPGTVAHAGAAAVPRALPNGIGLPLVLAWFVAGGLWITRRTAAWPGFTPARRWTFALLALAMAGTVIKIALRVGFGIHHLVRFERLGLNL